MSSPPAFQLYVRDFLGDHLVDAMEPEELGGYFRLLLIAWQQEDRGYLPNDPAKLAGWSKLGRRWKKHSAAVLAPFRVAPDGRLFQKRMVEVALEQAEYRERQRQKGIASAAARAARAAGEEILAEATARLERLDRKATTVQPRLPSGSSSVPTEGQQNGNPPPLTPPPPESEALSRAPARVDGPPRKSGRMAEAWSKAGLPGLPDAHGMSGLSVQLMALELDPFEACRAFKALLDGWREGRNIIASPTPAKMQEHLALVHQVVRGEVDPGKIGKAAPARGAPPEPKQRAYADLGAMADALDGDAR